MEEEIKIGQEKIFMQPVNVFDCIIIDYEKVKIIKIHKKSVKIKLIEECGVGHGTTLISFEKLKDCYFNSMKDALKWNKGLLDRTIKNREEILSHFRETHPKFKTQLSEINLLKEYLKLIDNFSVENYNNIKRIL